MVVVAPPGVYTRGEFRFREDANINFHLPEGTEGLFKSAITATLNVVCSDADRSCRCNSWRDVGAVGVHIAGGGHVGPGKNPT